MLGEEHVAVAAGVSACLILLIVVLLLRCFCCLPRQRVSSATKSLGKSESLQIGIAELHRQSMQKFEFNNRYRASNYNNVYQKEQSSNLLFNWTDHPSLVSDAYENGWTEFAFFGQYSSSLAASRSNRAAAILGSCAAVVGDRGRDKASEIESTWEIADASSDLIQKIRLNPELKRPNPNSLCVTTTILPLPGPCLGNTPTTFPQEAYFEITVLSSVEEDTSTAKRESEKTKLMDEKVNSESSVHAIAGNETRNCRESGFLSVGLSRSGYLQTKKIPGTFHGSVGFNSSNGSVYLDGIKHWSTSKDMNKLEKDQIIGCGYNPSKKEVIFTMDSELICIIQCNSIEYGSPLYPTLASDMDLTLRINLGQSSFSYAPANLNRNPNPCFIAPLKTESGMGLDEDSKELFSMGRIDSQWLKRGTSRGGDYDAESEGDLFEIVIDGNSNKYVRSPNPIL